MFNPIDQYCERLGPGLWAEPLNALTNLGFIIAAFFSFRLARNQKIQSTGAHALWVLMFVIGIGSGLFHTFANKLTEWMDVLPILFFQLTYLWVYCRRVIGFSVAHSVLAMLGFWVLVFLSQLDASLLNRSIGYAPAYVAILILGLFHFCTIKAARYSLLLSVLLFSVSLFLRTIDNSVCSRFPIGTHFLWHSLNALVLYFSARGLYLNLAAASSK